jgi:glycosyltransferase involved in cell wall biosynthesis
LVPQCPNRAVIPPVPASVDRPLWSVMIPTYNCSRYLRETLESVLAQDPGIPIMQIEVVDDHSTDDDPEAIVAEIAGDRISFFRHARNVGHIKNFETCLRRSRGHLVHLLHGDDSVRHGFYEKMQEAFAREVDLGAAFCRQIFIDGDGHWQGISELEQRESGILDNWLERLAVEQRIMTPSIVVPRVVYETLGGFDSRLICSEDWEMWVRIAARYPIWYEVQPLALYRMHDDSQTGRHVRSAEDISFTCEAIDQFKFYLPKDVARKVVPRAKETYAIAALRTARKALDRGDFVTVRSQVRAALKCSRSARVLQRFALLAFTGAPAALSRSVGRRSRF